MRSSVKRVSTTIGAFGAAALGAVLLGLSTGPVGAQTADATPAAVASPAGAAATGARTMLSLTEIEKVANAQGVRVTELEVKDNVVEVEGRDSSNREVKLLVDRRSGEILSRRFDD